jgi:RNA polymerase sigma-70 factor (ECF subfamily)
LTTTRPNTEHQLFARIAADDEAAFLELFHKYVPQLRPVMLQLIKADTPLSDLIQDIFLRIWLNRKKLTDVVSPRSWIFSLAYHHCFNYLRQQAVEARHFDKSEWSADPAANFESPEERSQFVQTKQFISEAVAALPPQAQKVYLMRREQEMSIEEVAAVLNVAPKTVKNTLTRALDEIRSYLQAKGVYLPVCLLILSAK